MIETIFDTLNAKAAVYAVETEFKALGIELPVMIFGTITDASGRTLSGQTTEAFYNSLRHALPLPEIPVACRLAGLEPLTIDAATLFVNVGERTNVTGLARFKRLIKEEKYG